MDNSKFYGHLSDHNLMQVIAQDYLPVTKLERQGVEFSSLAEQQQYFYEVGFRAGQVLNQLERIEQARILLRSYPYIKKWREHFGQFEYFQYNAEAYYLGVAGLIDRLLILVNWICELNIQDKSAKMTPIIKALKKANYGELVAHFEDTKVATESVKTMRNEIAHAQRFHENDLWLIAVLEFHVRQMTWKNNDEIKEDLSWHVREYRQKIEKRLNEINASLEPLIKLLFDMLEPIYLAVKEEKVKV